MVTIKNLHFLNTAWLINYQLNNGEDLLMSLQESNFGLLQ